MRGAFDSAGRRLSSWPTLSRPIFNPSQNILSRPGRLSLYEDALSSYPSWLPLLHLNARHAHACHATPLKATTEVGASSPAYSPTASDVVKACDDVISRVDVDVLARFLGVKHDGKDAERNEEKKVRERERERERRLRAPTEGSART